MRLRRSWDRTAFRLRPEFWENGSKEADLSQKQSWVPNAVGRIGRLIGCVLWWKRKIMEGIDEDEVEGTFA